ncbi:hypothetical protein BS47DRAFT_1368127 [Hydnum rufescens UP504]|uniref:Uncharacterized protein n=1 Tax=Hydnum rufescens UP504 TaxID=1448309 RepID=A0A9P6AGE0_9AGAM|nr:hypothetical protein BS47DRAFT_1368127 [Hydnum rufescens UP504]
MANFQVEVEVQASFEAKLIKGLMNSMRANTRICAYNPAAGAMCTSVSRVVSMGSSKVYMEIRCNRAQLTTLFEAQVIKSLMDHVRANTIHKILDAKYKVQKGGGNKKIKDVVTKTEEGRGRTRKGDEGDDEEGNSDKGDEDGNKCKGNEGDDDNDHCE